MAILAGIAKLASNFLGGGAGKEEKTTTSQNQTMKTTGQTTASRKEYSDGFLRNLETTANDALGRNAQSGKAVAGQLAKVQEANLGGTQIAFDPDAYIRWITESANRSIDNTVRGNTNAIAANTGGSASGNSAAALLASRLSGDAAAQKAGVAAEATAQATDMQVKARDQRVNELGAGTTMINSLSSTGDAGMTTLLNALRGGETFQEVNNNETQQSSGTGTSQTKTPFNWTAGLGNIFKDVNQD